MATGNLYIYSTNVIQMYGPEDAFVWYVNEELENYHLTKETKFGTITIKYLDSCMDPYEHIRIDLQIEGELTNIEDVELMQVIKDALVVVAEEMSKACAENEVLSKVPNIKCMMGEDCKIFCLVEDIDILKLSPLTFEFVNYLADEEYIQEFIDECKEEGA